MSAEGVEVECMKVGGVKVGGVEETRGGRNCDLPPMTLFRDYQYGGWLSTETQLGDRTLLNPLTEGPAI